MARKSKDSDSRSIELLEKLVLLQLHSLGATQDKMARYLGKQKAWVNGHIKDLPKVKKDK